LVSQFVRTDFSKCDKLFTIPNGLFKSDDDLIRQKLYGRIKAKFKNTIETIVKEKISVEDCLKGLYEH